MNTPKMDSSNKEDLTIESIYIGDSTCATHTEMYLASLSEPDYAALRASATHSNQTGSPYLRCGDCKSPVYVRESVTGRRHCFHVGTEQKNCRWSNANAKNFRAIDAEKFQGNQEGERHKALISLLRENLLLDNEIKEDDIAVYRHTKGVDGDWTYPDVYVTSWQGKPTVFEIQLATTQLPTITRREAFYERNNIRLCWIVDKNQGNIFRRAFKDIYLRNDGQILGIDEDVLKESHKETQPLFRLYRLLPNDNLKAILKNRIVRASDIAWGDSSNAIRSIHGSYDDFCNKIVVSNPTLISKRERFYQALADCDDKTAGIVWNEIAQIVGGRSWKELGTPYETVRALGVLATVRRKTITTCTKDNIKDIVNIVNSMLLEPKERRRWTNALKHIAEVSAPQILKASSVQTKIKRNNLEDNATTTSECNAGEVLSVFFPEGAFARLRLIDRQNTHH